MGSRVWGLGFGVEGLGSRVWGLGFGVGPIPRGLRVLVSDLGSRGATCENPECTITEKRRYLGGQAGSKDPKTCKQARHISKAYQHPGGQGGSKDTSIHYHVRTLSKHGM